MTIQVTARVRGLRRLNGKLDGIGENVREELKRVLLRTAHAVERDAKRGSTVDTGRMRAAIGTSLDATNLRARVIAKTAYSPFVEFGTGPHGRRTQTEAVPGHVRFSSRHFPPSKALIPWVRRKLGVAGEKEQKRVAFLVARAIFRRGGLKSRPFMRPAIRRQQGAFVVAVRQAIRNGVRSAI